MKPDDRWLGTKDAAAYLGVVPRTLYGIVNKGEVVAFRPGRCLRYRVSDLDSYLESVKVQPGQLGKR